MSAADRLLAGDPLGALPLCEDTERGRVERVRALVWIGDVSGAERVHLGFSPLEKIGHSVRALARGEPARSRLWLLDDEPESPDDQVLHAISSAESTRAAGDLATATQHAGRAVIQARGRDPRWGLYADLALTRCLHAAGDSAAAFEVGRQNLVAFRERLPGTVALAEALDVVALLHRQLGRPVLAVKHHREALALWRTLGNESVPVATCTFQLAQATHRTGDRDEALELMRLAFLLTTRCLGADHLDTWTTRFELGRLEVDAGDPFEGLPRMEAAFAEVSRRLGVQHPLVRSMKRYL